MARTARRWLVTDVSLLTDRHRGAVCFVVAPIAFELIDVLLGELKPGYAACASNRNSPSERRRNASLRERA